MDTSSYLSMTSIASLNPLQDDHNIVALKTLEDIIRTSFGPCGKLKVIQNAAGGHVTVTSSSQRLLHIISIQNTFLKLIVSSTKAHLNCFNNCGLSCSLLTLKLINNSLSGTYPLPLKGKLFEYFGNIFVDLLNSEKNNCIFKIDLSSLAQVQSIVETILQSKPGCILQQEDIQHLSILLLKGHLNAIPTSTSDVYHELNFITLEGTSCSKSCLYEGLLIKISEMPLKNLTLLNKLDVKIVLFTTSLSGDAEFPVDNIEVNNHVTLWEYVLNFMKNVIRKVIDAQIHILACQKVIHPSLKKQLEDANILVLDRLGLEASKHLEYLLGASNSSLFYEPVFGFLSCINKITIGRNNFLMLSNASKPLWTILICNFNEQAVNETKVVCQQAADTLLRLLKNPSVCFGAGCSEVHTSKLVEQKVIESLQDIQQEIKCTASQILEALQIFKKSVTDLAISIHQGSCLNFVTETVYGHLWRLNEGKFPLENDKCLCRRFSAVNIQDSNWKFFTHESSVVNNESFRPVEAKANINKSVILDELQSKINAYNLAFETASLMLRVSVCVHS